MSENWVSQFVDALHAWEDGGELEPLVSQFAPDAGLWNLVRSEPMRGMDQVREFWTAYRHQFDQIHSTFERIIEGASEAALEWRADGSLRGGKKLSYRGVTLLQHGDAGVTQFASYFDPRPFLTPGSAIQGAAQQQTQEPMLQRETTHELRSEEEIEEEAPSVMSYG